MGSLGMPKIVLKCKDGVEFEVSKAVASQMQSIKHLITRDVDCIIPLPEEVRGPVLAMLILYCDRHAKDDEDEDKFVKLPQGVIFDLLLGADILGMGGLIELLCQTIADMLKDKKIVLKCKDGCEFVVSKELAFQVQNIKHLMIKDDDHDETRIPVPDEFRGPVLAKLLQCCNRHAKASLDNQDEDNLKSFDDDFFKQHQHQALLSDLLFGAHKLGMGGLVELLCQTVADMSMQDKSDGIEIVLKCKDGREFEVSKAVAFQMQNIKHMSSDDETSNIPLHDEVRGHVIAKLIEYCDRHAKDDQDEDNLKFDDEFVKNHQHQALLSDILWGANKLGTVGLVELLCKAVADMIKNKSPEEIRKMFNIKNDFTPEDEEQFRNDHSWISAGLMGSNVVLKCKDGTEFEVSKAVASQMKNIKLSMDWHLITKEEDDHEITSIPLPEEVRSHVLAKLLEYCDRHANTDDDDNLKSFDDEFVKLPQSTMFDLILDAHKLGVGGLLDLLCQRVANMMKGKSTEEIRKTFNVKNDLTPEEEAQIREENPWAFE